MKAATMLTWSNVWLIAAAPGEVPDTSPLNTTATELAAELTASFTRSDSCGYRDTTLRAPTKW